MAKFNQPDPRNAGTWCWVNGLVKREEAKVSVLDSVVKEATLFGKVCGFRMAGFISSRSISPAFKPVRMP